MPNGKSLNEHLVREGFARVFPQYCAQKDICAPLRKLEQGAGGKKVLWEDKNPVPLWGVEEEVMTERCASNRRQEPRRMYDRLQDWPWAAEVHAYDMLMMGSLNLAENRRRGERRSGVDRRGA